MKVQSKAPTGIENFSFWRGVRNFSLICSLAGLVLSSLTGCDTLKRRGEIEAERSGAPSSAPQPTPPVTVATPPPLPEPPVSPQTPTFLSRELPKVGVILGAGGLKSFAHLGVLREFTRARIPIHAIVGMEWGAVMGGLYATKGQINDAEWKAFKLKESELPDEEFLSARIKARPVSSLQDFMQSSFGGAEMTNAKIGFACPTFSSRGDRTYMLSRGAMKDAVSRCLPYPPLFVGNGGYFAAPFAMEESVAWLRSQGVNLIVLVNVLGQGEVISPKRANEHAVENLLWSEVRRNMLSQKSPTVHYVIHVNTKGHPITDFNGRRATMDAGAKAAGDVVRKMVSKYGF